MIIIVVMFGSLVGAFAITCWIVCREEEKDLQKRNAIFNSLFEETNGLRK